LEIKKDETKFFKESFFFKIQVIGTFDRTYHFLIIFFPQDFPTIKAKKITIWWEKGCQSQGAMII
jgi:hypothetical protein